MTYHLPPICQGTEKHFESHDYGDGKGPIIIYWVHQTTPRFWSHDSDYPWRMDDLKPAEREHIARHQIVAWQRLDSKGLSLETEMWRRDAIDSWMKWETNSI